MLARGTFCAAISCFWRELGFAWAAGVRGRGRPRFDVLRDLAGKWGRPGGCSWRLVMQLVSKWLGARVLVLHVPAGGGHRAAARAVAEAAAARGVEAEVVDALELTPGWFARAYVGAHLPQHRACARVLWAGICGDESAAAGRRWVKARDRSRARRRARSFRRGAGSERRRLDALLSDGDPRARAANGEARRAARRRRDGLRRARVLGRGRGRSLLRARRPRDPRSREERRRSALDRSDRHPHSPGVRRDRASRGAGAGRGSSRCS